MKIKRIVAALALAAVALPAAAAPKPGGELRVGIASSAVTNGIDPHVIQGGSTGWVLGQIAEGLLAYNQNMNIVPWLAENWTVSLDGLTYDFSLRPGVTFQNGREMTAEDVRFSLERILNPETGSRRRQNLSAIESIAVTDPHSVPIGLKAPFGPFLSNLVGVWGAIVPPESVDADGTISRPVGTGPFGFVDCVKNDHLTVTRHGGYWRAASRIWTAYASCR